MDFARKLLEKYGWSDGKGLGKHENGISEALKPKLKRSVTGIGHDPAAEFNEHWWSALYDKAAKNVEVEDKNGKTKKIKTKDSDLVISSSTWRINKKRTKATDESEYSEYFVRTEVLTNDKGGRKTETVRRESHSDEDDVKKDCFRMTDEELFAACEGRTAHKGARHGLRAIGKLARIAEQEQKLLIQPQYEGYSHAKKLKQKEKAEQMSSEHLPQVQMKKKKRKHRGNDDSLVECDSMLPEKSNKDANEKKARKNKNQNGGDTESVVEPSDVLVSNEIEPEVQKTKRKKDKNNELVHSENNDITICDVDKKKSKKKRKLEDAQTEEVVTETNDLSESKSKKKKKVKNRNKELDY